MLGNILLTLALISGIFAALMYYYTEKGYSNTLTYARWGFNLMAVFVISASILLLYSILTHQYQYEYIYQYSGNDLSTGLLMSTFYAGQEGSFLLWAFFTSIVGLILLDYSSKREGLEPSVMMVFSLASVFLLIMINPLLKSPFTFIWSHPNYVDLKNVNQSFLSLPGLQKYLFTDTRNNSHLIQMSKEVVDLLASNGVPLNKFLINGKGLNPLLQNFWMQIHPPMLFVGFALSTVPFAFAFAALIKNHYKDWIRQAFPWMITSMMILGLGIMLGGYWAYGVLGWGGYWGWDPVENSSLVPWIIGVAAIHTFIVQKKTQKNGGNGKFVKTNLVLSMLTYLMVLYSTFLTRSGILGDASVHSFAEPGMAVYLLLLAFIGTFTIIGIVTFAWRWKYLEEITKYEDNFFSRELALFAGSIVLLASALIITVGTSMPIFGTSVQISFYNELHLPLAIILALINAYSIYFHWQNTSGREIFNKSVIALSVSLILTVVLAFVANYDDIMLLLFTFASVFALVVNFEVVLKVFKKKKVNLGGYVTHIGLAIFFLGVISTGGFSKTKHVDLVKGQPADVLGYNLTFTGYEPIENGKKYAFNINVKEENGTVSPVMYISSFNNGLMREPDMLTKFDKDIYISPVSYDDGSNAKPQNVISLRKGQSHNYKGKTITFKSFDFPKDAMAKMQSGETFRIGTLLEISDGYKKYSAEPYANMQGTNRTYVPVVLDELDLKLQLTHLDASGHIELSITDSKGNLSFDDQPKEILTIEASIKPFINLVWIGVAVMVFGFYISFRRRLKEAQN